DTLWRIDTQTFTTDWLDPNGISDFNFITRARNAPVDGVGQLPSYLENTNLYVEYNLASHGFFQKPASWTGRRSSPDNIHKATSTTTKARNAAYEAFYNADAAKYDLDWAILELERQKASHQKIRDFQTAEVTLDQVLDTAKLAGDIAKRYLDQT